MLEIMESSQTELSNKGGGGLCKSSDRFISIATSAMAVLPKIRTSTAMLLGITKCEKRKQFSPPTHITTLSGNSHFTTVFNQHLQNNALKSCVNPKKNRGDCVLVSSAGFPGYKRIQPCMFCMSHMI